MQDMQVGSHAINIIVKLLYFLFQILLRISLLSNNGSLDSNGSRFFGAFSLDLRHLLQAKGTPLTLYISKVSWIFKKVS
jgi:hypothetical protein